MIIKARSIFGIIAVAILLPFLHAKHAGQQPDILLIMPDQWRGDTLSILDCAGVNTPQLDQLAGEGALFRRAYATVPSCIPARYGFLTGLFPQTSGVVGFQAKPITVATLPGMLSEAGYHSVLVGRNMHQVKELSLIHISEPTRRS